MTYNVFGGTLNPTLLYSATVCLWDVYVGVGADDSFTRFNITMVQQYFREEAVHQQHKVGN